MFGFGHGNGDGRIGILLRLLNPRLLSRGFLGNDVCNGRLDLRKDFGIRIWGIFFLTGCLRRFLRKCSRCGSLVGAILGYRLIRQNICKIIHKSGGSLLGIRLPGGSVRRGQFRVFFVFHVFLQSADDDLLGDPLRFGAALQGFNKFQTKGDGTAG